MPRRLRILASAMLAALLSTHCGDDEVPPPPDHLDPNGAVCVCPGLLGRVPFGCPKEPVDGKIFVDFAECDAASAIFLDLNNRPVCRADIFTSNSTVLSVLPNQVEIPMSTAQNPTTRFFFNTVANDPATVVNPPPNGVVTVSARDRANNQTFPVLTVKVSSSCP